MLEQNTKLQLLEAHNKLREASQRAALSIIDDSRLLSSFEKNERDEEEVIERRLVRGLWIELFDGVKMMLIDDDSGWTRALCQSNAVSPKHYHTYYEKIKVIEGSVREMTTNKVYARSGDTIEHEPYIYHQPFINGLVMMMWKPPLPNLHNTPSILDPVIYHIAS